MSSILLKKRVGSKKENRKSEKIKILVEIIFASLFFVVGSKNGFANEKTLHSNETNTAGV